MYTRQGLWVLSFVKLTNHYIMEKTFCRSPTLPTLIWGCNFESSQVCLSEHPSWRSASPLSLRSSEREVAPWTSEAPIQTQKKSNLNIPLIKYLKVFLESGSTALWPLPMGPKGPTCVHTVTQCSLCTSV